MTLTNLKPFIKWAGGKRRLIPKLLSLIPNNFKNYFEPFVGSGALFFELSRRGLLNGKKVYLFDINDELINTYQTIKNNPIELLKILKEFQAKHSKEFYYSVRAMDRELEFKSLSPEVRAARFIYLNKTCFNGLWRVNSKGCYNVPMGRYKNPSIYDENTIIAANLALQNVEIKCTDFAEVLSFTDKEDFVYFDPPYYPISATSNFTKYHENIFLDEEQKRLFNVFKELDKKGVYILESNSNSEFIKMLYSNYTIEFIEVKRLISSKANMRGKIKELIILNK